MPCLFALMAGMFPRLADIILWIARPAYFTNPFGGSWFWPLLGIIFLPFTTLMYVLLWSPTGLTGWDLLWVVLAVFLDLSHYAHTAYSNRQAIPGYSSTPTAPSA
jgi:hypothetical protein